MKHWDLPEDWEIEAALPEYVDGEGDATRLCLADGTDRLVRARLRTVLERLARRHCRSLPLLRAWAKERTALAQTAPLAIASELVLVPFRARRPRIRGDAAMGVVNAMHAQLVRSEEMAEIELSCGRRNPRRPSSRGGNPAARPRCKDRSCRTAPPLLAEGMESRFPRKEIEENERTCVERRSEMGCGALCCVELLACDSYGVDASEYVILYSLPPPYWHGKEVHVIWRASLYRSFSPSRQE